MVKSAMCLPGSLGNEQPHADHEGQADAGVEPARLQAPVPHVRVDHVRRQLAHGHADDAGARRAEPRRVGPEALGGNLADEAPSRCSVSRHADV